MTAAGRAFRARVNAALGNHTVTDVDGGLCDGSGWPMRRSCTGTDGRVSCPLGGHRVTATAGRRGVVTLDAHQPGNGARDGAA
jgi:hypothetical protein